MDMVNSILRYINHMKGLRRINYSIKKEENRGYESFEWTWLTKCYFLNKQFEETLII